MVSNWINYKGKEILYHNYSNLKEEEYLKAMDDAYKMSVGRPKKSVLCMINVADTYTTRNITKKAKQIMEDTKVYQKAIAIVGVSGVKRIIAKMLVKGIYFATDETDAKEWLVRQ